MAKLERLGVVLRPDHENEGKREVMHMHGLRMFGLFSGFGLEPWGGTRDSHSPPPCRRGAS